MKKKNLIWFSDQDHSIALVRFNIFVTILKISKLTITKFWKKVDPRVSIQKLRVAFKIPRNFVKNATQDLKTWKNGTKLVNPTSQKKIGITQSAIKNGTVPNF